MTEAMPFPRKRHITFLRIPPNLWGRISGKYKDTHRIGTQDACPSNLWGQASVMLNTAVGGRGASPRTRVVGDAFGLGSAGALGGEGEHQKGDQVGK